MSDVTELDTTDLAAELERRREAAEAEQAERQRQEEERQLAASRDLIARYPEVEEAKIAEAAEHARAFSAAVAAGDMNAALGAWIAQRTTRFYRTSLRNSYRNALMRVGDTKSAQQVADVRWYDPDFLSRLESEANRYAEADGYDAAAADFPTN